jgi:ABC-type nitrate/sulfonate/bicarbonate transport system substrate-binding protein
MKIMLETLLLLVLFHSSAHAADKIRIAVPEPNAAYMTFPLAQKKGFLAGEGVSGEVISMRGALTIPALDHGEIDYLTDISRGVRGAIGGFPLRIVACYLPRSSLMLVTRPDINSMDELKGKTVAVAAIGSTNFAVLLLLAKRSGIDPAKEIKVVAVGANEARLAALKQGLVDAIVVPPPWDFHAQKLGFHVIAKSHEFFSYPQVGLITYDRKIKQRPEEILRVIKAGILANRYIRSHREGTVQFLMEWMRIDKDVAAATYESLLPAFNEDGALPEDGMRLVIQETKKAAKVSRELSIKDFADLSILREAQRELGIVR